MDRCSRKIPSAGEARIKCGGLAFREVGPASHRAELYIILETEAAIQSDLRCTRTISTRKPSAIMARVLSWRPVQYGVEARALRMIPATSARMVCFRLDARLQQAREA